MSDTTKLIIGIALAIVVVALIIWLFASARRREAEARRMEAEAMRAKLAERVPVVQEREDRASVTARIAQEARREAEAAAAGATRLEREAAEHRTAAEAARSEQEELARLADHVDPDVPTDREGFRVDDSGRRVGGSPVASALGMSAITQDDDEPDLADHENPFAAYSAEPAPTDPTPTESTPTESSAQKMTPEEAARSAHSSAFESAEGESSVQKVSAQDMGEDAEADSDVEADWVNGPVDEEAADDLEARTMRDAQEPDWINGPEDADEAEEAAGSAHSTDEGVAGSAHSTGVGTGLAKSSAQKMTPEGPAGSAHSTEGVAGSAHSTDEGAPFDPDDEEPPVPARRRVSGLDEVADGGYGVGSAAPIGDGAQPLGHPIMGYHETRTFLVPEAPGYGDSEPDVWFYDEDAARRAGFHAAGEA